MTTSIVKYTKAADQWTDIVMRLPDSTGRDDELHCTELCTLDGITYVAVPDGVTLPDQPHEITIEPVTLTPELKAAIRDQSPHCSFIDDRMKLRIRAKYSQDDELKFSRLSLNIAIGEKLTKGQISDIKEYNQYIVSCIDWAKSERAKLGL